MENKYHQGLVFLSCVSVSDLIKSYGEKETLIFIRDLLEVITLEDFQKFIDNKFALK